MKGRPPKPTALKEAEGNRGKRRAPPNEPKPSVLDRVPPPPKHLNEDAAAEWRRVSHQLQELGLLTDLDIASLVAYCASFARFLQAERQLAAEEVEIRDAIAEIERCPEDFTTAAMDELSTKPDDDRPKELTDALKDERKSRQRTLDLAARGSALLAYTGNGNLIQHPLVGISRRATADMLRFAEQFGMTPSARSRIDTEKANLDATDPAAAYF